MSAGTHRRGPWSRDEDVHLMSLVQAHGAHNWVRISSILNTRTPKQCRERFHQNLKPSLNHGPITPEEGREIERLVGIMGKRWAEIARHLQGRSDNSIKNWWNGSQNRRKRVDRQRSRSPPLSPYNASSSPYATMYPAIGVAVSSGAPHRPSVSRSPNSSALFQPRAQGAWPQDVPSLLSPCASDPAEADSASNYTTSPALRSPPIHPPVSLPPLRCLPQPPDGQGPLPSFNSLAGPTASGNASGVTPYHRRSLSSAQRLDQLPTAPSSPGSQHQQSNKDARMNLSTLLG